MRSSRETPRRRALRAHLQTHAPFADQFARAVTTSKRPDDRAGPRGAYQGPRPSVIERPVPKTTPRDRRELAQHGFLGASRLSNDRAEQTRRARLEAFLREPRAEPASYGQRLDLANHPVDEASIGDALLNKAGLLGAVRLSAEAAPSAGAIGHRIRTQVSSALVNSPVGLAVAAGAIGHDITAPERRAVTEATGGRVNLGGQWVPTHTAELAKQIGVQTAKDFTQRGREGYTLLDLLALAPTGAGLPGKIGAGVERAGEAAGAAGKTRAFARGFRAGPTPEEYPLTVRTDVGTDTVHRLLPTNPLAKKLAVMRNDMLQRRINRPDRPIRLGAPTRARLEQPRAEGGYGMPPRAAAVVDKLTVPQVKVAQLLSRHFGPEAVFSRERRADRRIDRAAAVAPISELRHTAGAPLGEAPILDRLPKQLRKGLSRGELKAIQALSIFGDSALLDPAGTIASAVGHHGDLAQQAAQRVEEHDAAIRSLRDGIDSAERSGAYDEMARMETQLQDELLARDKAAAEAERHHLQGADFKLAMPALERLAAPGWDAFEGTTPGETALEKAARLTRGLSEERQRRVMAEELLRQESAGFREAAPAAVYRGEPLTDETRLLRTRADNPHARALTGELGRLDQAIGKLQDQYRRSAKRLRPRSRREAEHELAQLEGKHAQLVARFTAALMSKAVTPEEAAAKITELEQEIEQHAGARDTATAQLANLNRDIHAGMTHAELERVYGAGPLRGAGAGGSRTSGFLYGGKHTVTIAAAERAIRKANLELGRYREAAKTGRYKIPLDPAETAKRNLLRRSGMKLPTLAEEAHQESLNAIEAAIEKHPEHPSFAQYRQEQATMERMRRGLELIHEAEDPLIGHGKPPPPETLSDLLGTVPVGLDEGVRHRLGALLEYRTKVEADLNRQLGNKLDVQTIADEIVHRRRELDQVPGAFRTPLSAPTKRSREAIIRVQPGEYGVPLPKPGRRDPALTHGFTGAEVEKGLLTADPVSSTIDSFLRGLQTVTSLEEYRSLWRRSHAARVHNGMIPVRSVDKVPTVIKRSRATDERNLPLTQADLSALNQGDLGALQRYLHPLEAGDGTPLYKDEKGLEFSVPIGWRDPTGETRWVDTRYFERYANTHLAPWAEKLAGAINNPVRFAGIYAKAGYAANLVSNFAMQALTQGFLAPTRFQRALNMRRELVQHLGHEEGEHVASLAESFVGEGKARSYSAGAGPLSKINDTVAQFWSSFIDRYSRLSALVHQAERHGVPIGHGGHWTADEARAFADFLQNKTVKRNAAIRRANKDLVEFNNLTPLERNVVRHVIFVYPWVSRSTIWAGRTIVENPAKMWTMAQLARVGEQAQDRDVGHLPSYLSRRGYFGGSHAGFTIPGLVEKGKPWLVNTAPLNPWQTGPETIEQAKGLLTGNQETEAQPSEALSPVLSVLFGGLGGATKHGFSAKGGLAGALGNEARSLPFVQSIADTGLTNLGPIRVGHNDNQRLRLDQRPVFARRGLLPALARVLSPVPLPKQANLDAAHAKARKELLASLPPEQAAVVRVNEKTSSWLHAARATGLYGKQEPWDPDMRQAIGTLTRREVMYAKAASKLGVPANRLKQLDRLRVDYDLLVQMGIYTRADADAELRDASSLDREAVRSQRKTLANNYFGATSITAFRRMMKEAGVTLK